MTKPKPKTGSRKKERTRTANGQLSTKLTRKQKAFADELINNPKQSNASAIMKTYNTTDTATASQMALENLNKPNIQLYLNQHVDKAKTRVVELVDSKREDIALRASQDILDRNLGKSVNRTIHSTGVNINFINSVPRPEQDNDTQPITEVANEAE